MSETDEQWAERIARGLFGNDATDNPEWNNPKFVSLVRELLREIHDEEERDKEKPSARLALFNKLYDQWEKLKADLRWSPTLEYEQDTDDRKKDENERN